MKDVIVKFIRNTFLTTGITLCILACVAVLSGGSCIFLKTVFQNFGANVCIHLGFLLTKRFESNYLLLDAAVDVAMITVVVLVFGAMFGWFSSTPVWVLILMVIIIYVISSAFHIFRVHEDIRYINEKLEQRRVKQ